MKIVNTIILMLYFTLHLFAEDYNKKLLVIGDPYTYYTKFSNPFGLSISEKLKDDLSHCSSVCVIIGRNNLTPAVIQAENISDMDAVLKKCILTLNTDAVRFPLQDPKLVNSRILTKLKNLPLNNYNQFISYGFDLSSLVQDHADIVSSDSVNTDPAIIEELNPSQADVIFISFLAVAGLVILIYSYRYIKRVKKNKENKDKEIIESLLKNTGVTIEDTNKHKTTAKWKKYEENEYREGKPFRSSNRYVGIIVLCVFLFLGSTSNSSASQRVFIPKVDISYSVDSFTWQSADKEIILSLSQGIPTIIVTYGDSVKIYRDLNLKTYLELKPTIFKPEMNTSHFDADEVVHYLCDSLRQNGFKPDVREFTDGLLDLDTLNITRGYVSYSGTNSHVDSLAGGTFDKFLSYFSSPLPLDPWQSILIIMTFLLILTSLLIKKKVNGIKSSVLKRIGKEQCGSFSISQDDKTLLNNYSLENKKSVQLGTNVSDDLILDFNAIVGVVISSNGSKFNINFISSTAKSNSSTFFDYVENQKNK